jgi:outer membrane protein OmpA-like peptidoglycan-associated protein
VPDEPSVGPEQSVLPGRLEPAGNGTGRSADLVALRKILVGPEQRRLEELSERVETLELTPAALAEQLPDAIALRSSRDRQLGRALAPTVETALRESIRRNPRDIATAIFPVLGPAIRKAIAETMAGLVRSINKAVEHSLSIRGVQWRIEAWRTGVPYAEVVIKHALLYRVEQVYLIHAETGLLLAHVSAADIDVPEADLISSMLTAIQDFVRDSFRPGEGATLQAFTVGEHTVQVEAGPRALLAAVIRGQAPASVTATLQSTLETIHLEYATQLTAYEGDSAVFDSARPLLEGCLETVLSTERRDARGKAAWLRWAVPFGVVVIAALAVTIRSHNRWVGAIHALESEPGFVVVNASRGWGGWRFAGLRDPMARTPENVLQAAGYSPRSLAGRWQPYLSMDSAIVVARARRLLSVPASATVSVRGDTLRVRGVAPVDWLVRTRIGAPPPGTMLVDVSALKPVLPAPLDSVKAAVEANRVLFASGSAELSGEVGGSLRTVAAMLRRLGDYLRPLGASLRVELVGRTDSTGADATNAALSQWRVTQVVGRLESLGVPRDVLTGHAVAAAQPVPAPTPDQSARVNRSVSFQLTIGAAPAAPREP